jgi:hypothetical protein
MAGRFECPSCHASLAYSAALAGRTVCCHHCQHSFEVAARALCPPPLPRRAAKAITDLPVATLLPASDEADEIDENVADDAVEERAPRRSPLTSAIFGLLAVYLGGFILLSSGIAYLVWSESTRPVQKPVDMVAPPIEAPVDYEQPKSLKEVLNEGSNDNVPKVNQPGGRIRPGGPPR